MFAFLGQPEYKPAETGPEADARYRRMRWQVFLGGAARGSDPCDTVDVIRSN